ncbi:hypothetical protein V8G54_007676 [Vigna mungo]|uniref:Uncharacterized protein n=1 Tax=Vigna mungo TaxID=3915 RepID=A0AAQ3P241_VIGMU
MTLSFVTVNHHSLFPKLQGTNTKSFGVFHQSFFNLSQPELVIRLLFYQTHQSLCFLQVFLREYLLLVPPIHFQIHHFLQYCSNLLSVRFQIQKNLCDGLTHV